ncbi:FACT complex subunit SSRP1-like [Mytilus californianus]|uniref:FACT complex subunit SSRP1-like n=1 Tax=Mytilus californianus TaxID=6549 RepID=UPI00224856CA|nr:FACT complex subunit SSRP1-like [Mytilus californianus]
MNTIRVVLFLIAILVAGKCQDDFGDLDEDSNDNAHDISEREEEFINEDDLNDKDERSEDEFVDEESDENLGEMEREERSDDESLEQENDENIDDISDNEKRDDEEEELTSEDDIVRRETLEELREQMKAARKSFRDRIEACGVKNNFVPMKNCKECRSTCRATRTCRSCRGICKDDWNELKSKDCDLTFDRTAFKKYHEQRRNEWENKKQDGKRDFWKKIRDRVFRLKNGR